MRIVRLDTESKRYVDVRDTGLLKPFTEVSLLAQLLGLLREMSREENQLIFSQEEEQMVNVLAEQVVGGLAVNRGHGHTTKGADLLLAPLIGNEGWYLSFIPADGNTNVPAGEVKAWSLAIRSGLI